MYRMYDSKYTSDFQANIVILRIIIIFVGVSGPPLQKDNIIIFKTSRVVFIKMYFDQNAFDVNTNLE